MISLAGRRVTIAGGGLAGLALGILLRQAGAPVTLREAGKYPRNKVCGEFISGAGQAVLEGLGALPRLGADVSSIRSAGIFAGSDFLQGLRLPQPALAIRRLDLDLQLALHFQELKGELVTESRWLGEWDAPGLVNATGRRPEVCSAGHRFYGLKAHFLEVPMASDLELHFCRDGYVGLLRLPQGMVNVCGLFRSSQPVPDLSRTWQERLKGGKDSILRSRLEKARLVDGTFCSVAALGVGTFAPRFSSQGFPVGDSMLMIPPFTGNGMSIAFETAALAAPRALEFLESGDWEEARKGLLASYRRVFARRMRIAFALQWAMFQPTFQSAALQILKLQPSLFNGLFNLTR